jgi:hypothetical protein
LSKLGEQVRFHLGSWLLREKRWTGFSWVQLGKNCWQVKRTMMQRRQALDVFRGHTLDPCITGMRMH